MNLLVRISRKQAARLLAEAGYSKPIGAWLDSIAAMSKNARSIGRNTDIVFLPEDKSPDKRAGFHINQYTK